MKKLIVTAIMLTVATMILWSQAPQAMTYKAMAKDEWGVALPSKYITLRFSIIQGSETGNIVYRETQGTTTNKFGLIDVQIGNGTPDIGILSFIDWGLGPYYIKIEMDTKGGTDFRLEDPAHQLLSVPYALYAGTSGNTNFIETDPFFTSSPSYGIWSSDISNWNSAFSWGNHIGLYKPISYVPEWNEIINKPASLAGYDITDAMSISHPANLIAASDMANWNNAFSWGNHTGLYKPVAYVPDWSEITSKPVFAPVAVSGSYNDLADKPTIDGSETIVLAGNNVTVTGEGTEGAPYVINSAAGGSTIPGVNTGDMMYWNGSAWVLLPVGSAGQVLSLIDGVPSWTGFGSAPVADFKATPVSSTEIPLTVTFTDLSTNLPTNWSWNFGDGSSSTLQNPSHVYSNADIYTVVLQARNIFGSSEFEVKTNYITVGPSDAPPTAAFTANYTSGGPEMEVCFFDQSTHDPESWIWDFGDGGTSTERSPCYIYYSTGNFTVSLTVTNSYGSDTETKVNYITVTEEGDNPDSDIIFNPDLTYGTVNDIDDNTYKTIQIGTQTWMAENIRTTKYNDGTPIPHAIDCSEWGEENPAFCWYNNDQTEYGDTYGALYNWYAISPTTNGDKNLCPTGWHVPSDAEWTILIDYLGGILEGGKLKETGILHWEKPNSGATNESGFTALPGGVRETDCNFYSLYLGGVWWSSSEDSYHWKAWVRYLSADGDGVGRIDSQKSKGFSVRCVKDQ